MDRRAEAPQYPNSYVMKQKKSLIQQQQHRVCKKYTLLTCKKAKVRLARH
jgi:hypothetical protein